MFEPNCMSFWNIKRGRIFNLSSCDMKLILHNLIILVSVVCIQSKPCTEYGCPGMPKHLFLPARPGMTPPCAQGGQTFCEHIDEYPQSVIKTLVQRSSIDLRTIIDDESQGLHNKYSPTYHDEGYTYPKQEGYQLQQQLPPFPQIPYPFRSSPSTTYGPALNTTYSQGYNYVASSSTQRDQYQSNSQALAKYYPNFQQLQHETYVQVNTRFANPYEQNQAALYARYARNDKIASRTPYQNSFLKYVSQMRDRSKRASEVNSYKICPTVARYIAPRAARSNKGDWKYVVNVKDGEVNAQQIVQTEVCTNTVCDKLCSIPEGYTSECKQQYVQKKLLALDESGQHLYVDKFTLPYGCACHVVENF